MNIQELKNVSPGVSLAKVLKSIGELVILGIAKLLDGVIDLIEMVEKLDRVGKTRHPDGYEATDESKFA